MVSRWVIIICMSLPESSDLKFGGSRHTFPRKLTWNRNMLPLEKGKTSTTKQFFGSSRSLSVFNVKIFPWFFGFQTLSCQNVQVPAVRVGTYFQSEKSSATHTSPPYGVQGAHLRSVEYRLQRGHAPADRTTPGGNRDANARRDRRPKALEVATTTKKVRILCKGLRLCLRHFFSDIYDICVSLPRNPRIDPYFGKDLTPWNRRSTPQNKDITWVLDIQ